MLKRLGNPVHEINFETKEGLSDQVEYAVGARVMLVRNLFVKAGLVNGAKGYIRDIVYNPGESSPSVPKFIMVRFDEYCGEYPADMDALPIPATPMTWDIPGEKGPVWITMGLPLVPAYSSTIHKTQGLTVDKLAIDFKNSKFVDCTMFFVAISRAKHLNDIVFLSDFSQPFVDHLRTCKHNDNMLIEEARLHDLYQNVLKAKME